MKISQKTRDYLLGKNKKRIEDIIKRTVRKDYDFILKPEHLTGGKISSFLKEPDLLSIKNKV